MTVVVLLALCLLGIMGLLVLGWKISKQLTWQRRTWTPWLAAIGKAVNVPPDIDQWGPNVG